MRRGAKPTKPKVKARSSVARKSLKDEGSRVRVLEKRLAEALEQQTATSEILRVISSSPSNIQPVFDAIAANAARLCDAVNGLVIRFDGQLLHLAAHHNVDPERLAAVRQAYPRPPSRGALSGRSILTCAVVHVPDVSKDPEYTLPAATTIGYRSVLAVPMMHEGVARGTILVARDVVAPFSDTHIALLQTFADQAVIAIENARLFNETKEALDQQTATSEILRVISSSPTDVQPVFEAIADSAMRLFDALRVAVVRYDGALISMAAARGGAPGSAAVATDRFRSPHRPIAGFPPEQTVLTKTMHHVADVDTDPSCSVEFRRHAHERGFRSFLSMPMLRGGDPVGVIVVSRAQPGAFSTTEIELLHTFADQAVIAIENVRLFTELQEKNRALTQAHGQVTEALAQQTATSEILSVISSSPSNVEPVFQTILGSTNRLCEASFSVLWLWDGEVLIPAAHANVSPELAERLRTSRARPRRGGSPVALTALEQAVIHVPDVLDDPRFSPADVPSYQIEGARSILAVPMLREGSLVGVINTWRREPRAFTDKQVELLKTFADQAVIAVENVRLFTELQQKNRDLTVALAQQTATSEILRTIAHAQTDVQPVFDSIVRSAARLCHAANAAVFLTDGTMLYEPSNFGSSPEARTAARARYPRPVGMDTPPGIAILTRSVFHLPDTEDPSGIEHVRQSGRLLGFRSVVTVPMLRDGEPVGAILVAREQPGRFSDAEVALLKTFADQAVIAVENVRLFKELGARTTALTRSVEQLTALGEVGRAVSSTLDLETVLTTIVARAVQLSGLDGGVVFEYDEGAEEFVQRAATETGGALAEARRATRIRKGEGALGRTAITLEPVQVPDITVPGAHESRLRDILIESGVRAVLTVPMVREGRLIGSVGVTRNRAGEFPAETIELLRTFATQSALAIQNARLFREIADKSRQLEAASRHKSEFLANMSHELRTPLNAIIGFSEVLIQRMFGELNEKQDEYLRDIYASGQHLLSLINDILDLSKIEAGRMELELADFDLPSAIDNALILVRERATRRGITLGRAIDERLGTLRGDERKVKQVLLNLLSNALKFTPEGGRVDVSARTQDGVAEIAVMDTGVGIAPEDQEAVFEEFRQVGTADRKVEGTGLGLALSRKFIELHGGRIWVKSQVGQGSTFTFTLPVGRED